MASSIRTYTKQIDNYETIIRRIQPKFNLQNEGLVKGLIYEIEPREMSQSIVDSIQENASLSYYYKLRILALKQKEFFNK